MKRVDKREMGGGWCERGFQEEAGEESLNEGWIREQNGAQSGGYKEQRKTDTDNA